MSLVEKILVILNYSSDYPKIYALLRNRTQSKDHTCSFNVSDNTLRVTLSRLKKKGLIKNKTGKWKITKKGYSFLKKIKNRKKLELPKHDKQKKSGRKNMIIIFDIPENQRYKRKWLRSALTNLGFEILQKSVWFGPTPLPKEFIKSLHELKLLPYIKFFKASEADIV